MRLTKIKVAGFKSFADATSVGFPSNLTGVVGPNGCGKSNIIDAVRWVMGELSAKHLRGDNMTDVIFNGSASRKPVGTASVAGPPASANIGTLIPKITPRPASVFLRLRSNFFIYGPLDIHQ
jgi:energy-coupling factor transporter ATP-binding protein EcfA2